MSDPSTRSALEQEAADWAAKHADEVPPPPAPTPNVNAPGSTATPRPQAAPSTPPPEEEEEPSDTAMDMSELAELGVAAIDFGIQNFVSPRCAFKPKQRAELGELGGKVLKKWFPDLAGAVEPEYAFVGAIGLFAWANYKVSLRTSPDPASAAASSAGGSSSTGGSSGGQSTSASVDGRPVNAEVLQ